MHRFRQYCLIGVAFGSALVVVSVAAALILSGLVGVRDINWTLTPLIIGTVVASLSVLVIFCSFVWEDRWQ